MPEDSRPTALEWERSPAPPRVRIEPRRVSSKLGIAAWREDAFAVCIKRRPVSHGLELARRHGFFWLFAGNVVGLLLALMLLWPRINEWITPLGYGRWVPVHLNLQLYGWTSLPLLGWLFHVYRVNHYVGGAWRRSAFWAWSAALVLGSVSWLAGQSSGKIFLDWAGVDRRFLFLAMMWVWLITAFAWLRDGRRHGIEGRRWHWHGKGLGLAMLLAVPGILYWAADPGVYPSVNPHSGGPTGASLLGSTLVVLLLLLLFPVSLRRPSIGRPYARWISWGIFLSQGILFAFMDHAHTSHHRVDQILGLGSLLAWLGLLPWYYRSFSWPAGAGKWQGAFMAWLGLLILTGFATFLPGVLERLKFTNGLVAHSHLAMAGFITAFNVFLLAALDHEGRNRDSSADRRAFWIWNGATLGYVVLMWIAGWREGNQPAVVFAQDTGTRLIYMLRLVCGAAMCGVSFQWWRSSCQERSS